MSCDANETKPLVPEGQLGAERRDLPHLLRNGLGTVRALAEALTLEQAQPDTGEVTLENCNRRLLLMAFCFCFVRWRSC